jgi:hypothetical protein
MPHDKNGKEVKVGDKVLVEMTVEAVYPGADTCNVSLGRRTEGEQQLSLTCQAAQTEIVAVAEPAVQGAEG